MSADLQADGWDATLRGLYRLARRRGRIGTGHNPRPAGVIREGSATEAVLALLQTARRRWWTEKDIVAATGRSRGAVTWSINWLRERGHVASKPGPQRSGALLHAAAGRLPAPTGEPIHAPR